MIGIYGPRQSGKTTWLHCRWAKKPQSAIIFPNYPQREWFISKYKVSWINRNKLFTWDDPEKMRGRKFDFVMIDNIDLIIQSYFPYDLKYVTFTGPGHELEGPNVIGVNQNLEP